MSAGGRAPSSTIWTPNPLAARYIGLSVCQQFPVWVDMTLYRGDSGAFWVSVHECCDRTKPLNLTDATWDCDIRAQHEDATPMVTLDVLPVWDTYPELYGTVEVVLTAAKSATLTGDGVWDLEMNLYGNVTTLCAGNVTVIKDVSRP